MNSIKWSPAKISKLFNAVIFQFCVYLAMPISLVFVYPFMFLQFIDYIGLVGEYRSYAIIGFAVACGTYIALCKAGVFTKFTLLLILSVTLLFNAMSVGYLIFVIGDFSTYEYCAIASCLFYLYSLHLLYSDRVRVWIKPI